MGAHCPFVEYKVLLLIILVPLNYIIYYKHYIHDDISHDFERLNHVKACVVLHVLA